MWRRSLKIGKKISQEHDDTITGKLGSEEDMVKREKIDMNRHDLRDELSTQKLSHQLFLFTGKIDLVGKVVETIMPFEHIDAFENFFRT